MLQTLQRYFLKRWTGPFLAALLFYGGLILANQTVQFSREIFSQGGAFRWMAPLLLTSLPEILGMVLPMAAVLGGLLGTQTLAEGSELVSSQGLGAGFRSILKPWGVLSVLLFTLATVNAHFLVPRSSRFQFVLQNKMLDDAQTRFLRPGARPYLPSGNPGKALWVAPEGVIHLMDVNEQRVQHLVAQRMTWSREEVDSKLSSIVIQMNDLEGITVNKETGGVLRLRQDTLTLRQPVPATLRPLPPTPVRYLETRHLIKTWGGPSALELSRRLSLPLAGCALLLFGIALGHGHPRFQRGGGAILKSLGVILGYRLVMQFLESQLKDGRLGVFALLVTLPILVGGLGAYLLWRRMHPHHSTSRLRRWLSRWIPGQRLAWLRSRAQWARAQWEGMKDWIAALRPTPRQGHRTHILRGWVRLLWWRNWGATLATFLALNLMIEYASLAGDLSKNKIPLYMFFAYWIYKLPSFLVVVLPLAFLIGGTLALSEMAISREWTALKSGGTSLLQIFRAGSRAAALVLLGTFLLEAAIAPVCMPKYSKLYRQILNRPPKMARTKPWLHLGSTGVLWYLDGAQRWGFPLKMPGEAPVLLTWKTHQASSQALPWDGLRFVQGPAANQLFPDRALRDSERAEETPTLDLFHWQRWAPDAERAALLWTRIFGWLGGPALLFAFLPFAFPPPREGRGRAIGYALVGGLLYIGAQALFGGAARAGEIPPAWGVLAPVMLLLGTGLWNLHKLRT